MDVYHQIVSWRFIGHQLLQINAFAVCSVFFTDSIGNIMSFVNFVQTKLEHDKIDKLPLESVSKSIIQVTLHIYIHILSSSVSMLGFTCLWTL